MTRIRSSRTNRFIRFGYRRPPPWTPPAPPPSPKQLPHHLRNPKTYNAWQEFHNTIIPIRPLPTNQDPSTIPALAHGIHVVLRGDGIYPLEAPWLRRQSRFYKDSLRKIVQPDRIVWDAIPSYITAADDHALHTVAEESGARYSSSTSSITPTIAAMYHLLSNFRNTDLLGGLSSHVRDLPSDFSKFHRRPVAFTISRNSTGGTFSISAHDGLDSGPSILRDLGHSMERMLTTPPQEFRRRFVIDKSARLNEGPVRPSGSDEQFYHYSRVSNFVLRAQIDCQNAETGEVFDVKTRAVAPIRYDLQNYHEHTSRRIRFLQGISDSYEREFYDMVRTVFLKYALQLRIGRMSGALVAYHNTTEVLGLEYISLKEIHSYIFGSEHWADIAFGTAVKLLEQVLETIIGKMGVADREKLKVVLSTEWSQLKMHVFVQRVRDGEDPLSCHRFLQQAPTSGMGAPRTANDFSSGGLWHVDACLHGQPHGISIIGAHPIVQKLGGEPVFKRGVTTNKSKRIIDDGVLKDIANDVRNLPPRDFRVWELKVAPFVNGDITPKSTFSMKKSDSFRLKYCLSEIPVRGDIFGKFLVSLGRVYIK